ncbi:MAG: hypothetical protein BWK80_41175 [Desulfobacteraceae bacterium IS3]|nr:MAG: hypothetical protein BWK80_41175 [Desulfobacteraceae bacterium IS3]
MKTTICTLGEGDFHHGLGTLVNSLAAHGFCGKIVVGWKNGEIPWLREFQKNAGGWYRVGSGIELLVSMVSPNMHLTNFKPNWMKSVMEEIVPETEGCFYFDPDVTVLFPWWFFEQWIADGVAVCEDRNSPMPCSHPRRNAWRRIFQKRSMELVNPFEQYANGGCVGVARSRIGFLDLWARTIQVAGEETGAISDIVAKPESWFPFMDQDALNVSLMATGESVSWVGKDGMNFDGRGILMHHDLGPRKPWRRSRLWKIAGRFGWIQHPCFRYARSPVKVEAY